MEYSSRSKTVALLPKFTGFLSLLGSTFIIQDVVFHKAPQRRRVYHRLVLGLSISDMIASVMNVLSTWPIPEGSQGVYLASGTTQTCTAQGFFNELGNLSTTLYQVSLCAYYVLIICNNWGEARIRSKAEPFMHILPVAIASVIAALGLPFKLYNNSGWLCWFATYPSGCQETGTCTRGEHADVFRWVHYAIIWSAIFAVTAGMYTIYRKVKVQELIQSRWSQEVREGVGNTSDESNRGTKSRKVAIQAALFVGALYLTWICTTILRIYQITTGNNSFVLLILMEIFFPLQGFFNCLVYIRPRYLNSRSRNPDMSVCRLMYLSLHHENHTIHKLQNVNQRDQQEGRKGRRSLTASYYSTKNSEGEYAHNSRDASYSINTVNAIASAPDSNAEAAEQPNDDRVAHHTKYRRATLDAVEETSITSDTSAAQEMVNK